MTETTTKAAADRLLNSRNDIEVVPDPETIGAWKVVNDGETLGAFSTEEMATEHAASVTKWRDAVHALDDKNNPNAPAPTPVPPVQPVA